MAPVGGSGNNGSGPYIIDDRKVLALRNSNGSALSDVTNQPNRAGGRRPNRGAGSSDIGNSSGVENTAPSAAQVAMDPYGPRANSDVDVARVYSARVNNEINRRRAAGTLPTLAPSTGYFHEHTTTEMSLSPKGWSTDKNATSHARVEVTASGLYSMTAALQAPAAVAAPTQAQPRKRSTVLTLR